MIMRWIILCIAASFAMSCSNEAAWTDPENGSLKVDLKMSEMSGGGVKATAEAVVYNDDAPDYVSGVRIYTENTDYAEEEKMHSFDLSINKDAEIKLNNITAGTTKVRAEGDPANSAVKEGFYSRVNILRAPADDDDLDSRAADYSKYFIKTLKKGLYSRYKSIDDKSITVSSVTETSVSLKMETEDHRLSIVLENPASDLYTGDVDYDIEMNVYEDEEGTKPVIGSKVYVKDGGVEVNDGLINQGEQLAFIINNEDATGDKTYYLHVKYYTTGSHADVSDKFIKVKIEVKAGSNNTKLFRFYKKTLLVGSTTVGLGWKFIEDESDGTILGDD